MINFIKIDDLELFLHMNQHFTMKQFDIKMSELNTKLETFLYSGGVGPCIFIIEIKEDNTIFISHFAAGDYFRFNETSRYLLFTTLSYVEERDKYLELYAHITETPELKQLLGTREIQNITPENLKKLLSFIDEEVDFEDIPEEYNINEILNEFILKYDSLPQNLNITINNNNVLLYYLDYKVESYTDFFVEKDGDDINIFYASNQDVFKNEAEMVKEIEEQLGLDLGAVEGASEEERRLEIERIKRELIRLKSEQLDPGAPPPKVPKLQYKYLKYKLKYFLLKNTI